MKKIFNIFAAALMSAAVLTSCAEKEIVTYDPDNTASTSTSMTGRILPTASAQPTTASLWAAMTLSPIPNPILIPMSLYGE